MSVHIVYCHPSKDSITYQIKQSYINGLNKNNINYTISDLYKNNFQSDMTELEYLREGYCKSTKVSSDVLKEQKLINNSNILTFIFPLFWMDAPSKLVGWFNRVFTYNFRYGGEETMKKLDKVIFLIVTGSGYSDLKQDGKIDALEKIFITDRISNKAKIVDMHYFSSTSREKEERELNKDKYIKKAFEIGEKSI